MQRNKLVLLAIVSSLCWASPAEQHRAEAEYYVTAYARQYRVPLEFVRALIEQESGWRLCPVSSKGAAGLMQLMPETAARLKVRNRCDPRDNISGGVRYLAWLMTRFHGDLRLVAAAYYAGESVVEKHGLGYANRKVILYVTALRARFEHEKKRIEENPGLRGGGNP